MSVARQEEPIEERPKVLVVDDEPFNLEIMQEILEEDYEVSYAKSGLECMDVVTNLMPDVVLLDVNMPGMSGYEVCQKLKENPKTTNIPVTFVSALDTLAERLAGYEVGGDDYICKPFEAGELLSKVTIAVKYKKERESLMAEAERAMSKAISVSKDTGDVDAVMDFMRSTLSCDGAEKLVDLSLYTISSMGLRSSVQIRIGDEVVHKSSDGAINQLERTVVKKICKEDRVVDLGVRSVFNFEHVSVLIKNMPLDNQEKYARVKTSIALLTEALELRLQALVQLNAKPEVSRSSNGDKSKFAVLAQRIDVLLAEIDESVNKFSPQYIKVLSELSYKLEGAFSDLALTEDQEQMVMDLFDQSMSQAHSIQANNDNACKSLAKLVSEIRDALNAD